MKPSDHQQLLKDIENVMGVVAHVSRMRGHDPADAMMMLLVGACQIFREYANDPDDLGGVHEALDKAFEAASSWWVVDETPDETPDKADDGSTLQ